MNRADTYEKGKISKATDGNMATNIYLDAFNIEKVRFQNVNYEDKTSIDCYVDFEEIAMLATGAKNNCLNDDLGAGKIISMGGSKSSKRYGGEPESRIMGLRAANRHVFIEMKAGKGKFNDHGLIFPEGESDKNITVCVPMEKFRSMIMYTYDCVRAYLPRMINSLVDELKEDRANYLASIKPKEEA